MQNDSRNTIAFFVIAVIMLFGYQMFILEPQQKAKRAEQKAKAAAEQTVVPGKPVLPSARAGNLSRAAAIAESPRVPIRTLGHDGKPVLAGSINLTGGRVDDLALQQYGQTVEKTSPRVDLLRPEGSANAFFAEFGWKADNVAGLPGDKTVWTVKSGQTLTEKTPVVLTYTSPQGLVFDRTISVDDHYMFTVNDTVTNTSAAPIALEPYAAVRRAGLPPEAGKGQNVHEGAVGWLDKGLRLKKYAPWKKDAGKGKGEQTWATTGGWLGITDKYWLAAIIPDQAEKIQAQFLQVTQDGRDYYITGLIGAAKTVAPGATINETTRLFAGAKRAELLKSYQKNLGVPELDRAIDWGVLFFLTRPFFMALEFFYGFVGNFGVAILLVTLCVRILLFPLANKSYESMSRMKKLTEPMNALKEKYKDDPAKLQAETMELYKREKVNPVAGCLPLFMQIPVFLAFYKVLSVTIEMRHAPFVGFVKDLSARDPTNIWNLFGLIPYDPGSLPLVGGLLTTHPAALGFGNGALGLGICVLVYGFTMWLTTAMNPPAPDPMQQKIFQLMPILFTFIMAPFAVGLIIYWTFSNTLSILQQYLIMHRLKVDNPIDKFLSRFSAKAA
ncbi:MAG: membrane protein insertase YidC [Caulobacter sp.]|nr:membrane protein insertase YidC [Caulobacter sp.]